VIVARVQNSANHLQREQHGLHSVYPDRRVGLLSIGPIYFIPAGPDFRLMARRKKTHRNVDVAIRALKFQHTCCYRHGRVLLPRRSFSQDGAKQNPGND
jgi:hypothetical protein